MTLTLYHNPRCSKSREALELLEARGLKPKVVHYLETPPNAATLKRIATRLGVRPREMMRSKDELFVKLGLDDPATEDNALIAAMAKNPQLIERPILVSGKRAVIGRPPERILEIL